MMLRRCLSDPIPKIAECAQYLTDAASAHLEGNSALAEELIRRADMPEIYKWAKPIWANSAVHLLIPKLNTRPTLSVELRSKERMPGTSLKNMIHQRDGYCCRFCGIPVVRRETRTKIRNVYTNALRWGSKEADQHSAFQVMWAQYDHVVPHAHGGTNDLDNLVLTCAPCNFGRAGYTLEEVGLADPRLRPPEKTDWDGLESFSESC